MQSQRVVSQFLPGVPNILPSGWMVKEHGGAEGHFPVYLTSWDWNETGPEHQTHLDLIPSPAT